jgi:hypothetical protein
VQYAPSEIFAKVGRGVRASRCDASEICNTRVTLDEGGEDRDLYFRNAATYPAVTPLLSLRSCRHGIGGCGRCVEDGGPRALCGGYTSSASDTFRPSTLSTRWRPLPSSLHSRRDPNGVSRIGTPPMVRILCGTRRAHGVPRISTPARSGGLEHARSGWARRWPTEPRFAYGHIGRRLGSRSQLAPSEYLIFSRAGLAVPPPVLCCAVLIVELF